MDVSKMTGQSTNTQAELLAKLMREMPEIFSEGKVDTKKLKATLGEDILTDQERYGLTWAGKAECFKKIQETTTNTLKPCRDESVDFDKTENLFIEGDKRVYFVAETKGTNNIEELSPSEKMKIICGRKHFEQFADVEFKAPVERFEEVIL